MHDLPRVLIGTLYSGENEFRLLKESLRNQSYPRWEQFVLDHLPNKEAHDRLYRTFMDQSSDYDLFLKLDADMVLSSPDTLRRIVTLFRQNEELDHAILGVHDWASDSVIIGMHAYSNRAVWGGSDEQLFVDYSPQIPGKQLVVEVPPSPLVDHSPDPSPRQAFEFGAHRAFKVVQRDKRKLKLSRSRAQWDLLINVWRQFSETGERRRGLILHGAECAFRGEVTRRDYDTTDDAISALFERKYRDNSASQLRERLAPFWEEALTRERKYTQMVGVGRIFWAALTEIPKDLLVGVYKRMSSQHIHTNRQVVEILRSDNASGQTGDAGVEDRGQEVRGQLDEMT